MPRTRSRRSRGPEGFAAAATGRAVACGRLFPGWRPAAHELGLLDGLRHGRPGARARIGAPQAIEPFERGRAAAALVRDPATGDEVRAADAGAAVQVHATARGECAVERIEDLAHLHVGGRHGVVADRMAQIADRAAVRRRGEQRLVGLELGRLGQVEETVDAGIDELREAPCRRGVVVSRGVLTGEHALRLDPVAVRQRHARHFRDRPAANVRARRNRRRRDPPGAQARRCRAP